MNYQNTAIFQGCFSFPLLPPCVRGNLIIVNISTNIFQAEVFLMFLGNIKMEHWPEMG